MESDLIPFTGSNFGAGLKNRARLLESAGEVLGAAASPAVLKATLARQTTVITLLAGAGTRWQKSLTASPEGQSAFPLDAPRGLYPVANLLDASIPRIPIASYSLAAGAGLGKRVLVTRGWEEAISNQALPYAGDDPANIRFVTQVAIEGKPRGHGDAVFQAQSEWADGEFVLVNFGGDAASPFTALTAVAVLAALAKLGQNVDLVLPIARVKSPAYPIGISENGLPLSFSHQKLTGRKLDSAPEYAYTNVGVRAYRTQALLELCNEARSKWFKEDYGYIIPGNDPEGREFALDNVDRWLAKRGTARLLAIARPEELTPVKSLDDVSGFERAMKVVMQDYKLVNH